MTDPRALALLTLLFALPGVPELALADDGNPPSSLRPARTPCYVTIHAGELGYDLNKADQVLKKVVDLGFEGVRTDVFWFDIEPTRNHLDKSKLRFYTSFVSKVRWFGLDPLIILSGAPQWATRLYNQNKAAFWIEYEQYVREVLLWIRDRVDNYQLWNEANHVMDPIHAQDDWQLFYRAGSLVKALDPSAKTYINVMADLAGWESAVTSWLHKAGAYVDVIGIDHYPGTWTCCSWTDWGPLDTLIRKINTPGTSWYGKEGMVMETGYSSWAWFIADEYDQRNWINQSIPAMRARIDNNHRNNPYRIVGVGFYQLIDTCTDAYDPKNCWSHDPIFGQGIEAHFGILHSNYSKKVGYRALQYQISKF